mmetsp:Transcript_48009/g.112079  ORF Transcript_48009/g.112079 Transcript_48009/m.112079 type:complete len:478 (+) Transcript_48009:94-1527(+)
MAGPIITSLNGFKTVAEIQSLVVEEENIAPYSMPQEVLSYAPQGQVVVHTFKNGDKERKIHCYSELEQKELQGLRTLRKLAADSQFFPSITSMATRYISRARGDEKKAFKLMEETQKWRREYFSKGPVTDKQVLEDMQHGIMYFTGRDRELRPTIIIRACRIPQKWYSEKKIDTVLRLLIFCMEYMLRYMVYPGKVENNNVIVDLRTLGVSQVPITALSDVYKIMSHHYMGRVYKFYICNMSWGLGTIAGAVKNILTDRQKQKLVFVDKIPDLLKDFAPHHLETDLGGTREIIKDRFFPFPLLPGPFQPGSSSGPDSSALPNAHDVLTPFGVIGRLMDNEVSDNPNSLPAIFTPKAAEIFRQVGAPVPAAAEEVSASSQAAQQSEPARGKADAESEVPKPDRRNGAEFAAEEAIPPVDHSKEEAPITHRPIPPAQNGNMMEHSVQQDSKQGAIEEDAGIQPAGFFSCGACFAKSCKA